ncbi:dTDP-4-dehydrorhamnose reductase [Corynebacterium sp. ES2715-CONJ3]|uniref:dTDP-4-dehydrorhamnose reductase n=1 Tax=Corynebacterium sp. ES2715-CONJ3 TaxID=2974028 RepID=UPI002169F268|nr:dTDP-4-dehydrorhamnose reductase [Corynebacterium sp. ES2715-CONJ3]MCS4491238.1 dTDP-4-dehydrorhamnose reductase [Corynebacterium sp. ES2715-CONJ3]
MNITLTPIKDLAIIHLDLHGDNRGWFKENWQREKFQNLDLAPLALKYFRPAQHNISFNQRPGVTRGMHAEPWNKLISLAAGEVEGAWIDLRADSPTFKTQFHCRLSPGEAVFVPRGVANGFQALTATSYSYLVDAHWSPTAHYSFTNLDEISWPLPVTEISEKDRHHPPLDEALPVPNKKVLVTGADGQVATALRRILPDAHYLTRAEFDIERPAASGIDFTKYSTIINTAAYTNVDACETDRRKAWSTNAQAVGALADITRDYDLCLVHISSDYVFDGDTAHPYTEMDIPSPLNVYGHSKAAGDIAAARNPKHYIIRTSWVVGDGKNFMTTMATLARTGINPQVVGDQFGRLTFANEIASGIVHLLHTQAPYGTYNLSNSGPVVSWYEIAQRVFSRSGHDPSRVSRCTSAEYQAVAPRPQYSVLDLAKIEATGFYPRDWQLAFEEMI